MIKLYNKYIKEKLQNKLFIVLFLISIVPIVLISIYSCNVAVNAVREKTEQSMITQLKNMDDIVFEKTKNIQRLIDIIRFDDDLQQILKDGNTSNNKFNTVFNRLLQNQEYIESAILITPSNNIYEYNYENLSLDTIKIQVLYSLMDERPGEITWYGEKNSAEFAGLNNNLLVAGTIIFNENETNETNQLAKMYVFIKKEMFNPILYNANDDSTTVIIDNKGKLFITNHLENYNNISKNSLKIMKEIFNMDEGIIESYESDNQVVIAHYASAITKFKFVKFYPADVFFDPIKKIIYISGIIIFIVIIIIFILYNIITKFTIKPIMDLSRLMCDYSESTLQMEMKVKNNDEIGMIIKGFNKMNKRINFMIEEVKKKEREKSNAEFAALSYQINPHFLYNTLSAMRVMSINKGDDETSSAILALNRLLKSTLANTGKMISLSEEIEQVKDYLDLLQLRYQGMLSISYKITEEVKNALIPNMLLQPIIENSIKHGLTDKINMSVGKNNICISANLKEAELVIEVFDNGIGMSADKIESILSGKNNGTQNSVGVKNINERLKSLYGEKYGVRIESKEGFYTSVFIHMPYKK